MLMVVLTCLRWLPDVNSAYRLLEPTTRKEKKKSSEFSFLPFFTYITNVCRKHSDFEVVWECEIAELRRTNLEMDKHMNAEVEVVSLYIIYGLTL